MNLWVDSESIRFKSDFCKFITIQFTIKFDSIGLTILPSLSAFTGFIKCLVKDRGGSRGGARGAPAPVEI